MKADFNEDLRESFLSYGLYLNLKKTIKNKYLEVCKMKAELLKDLKVVDLFMLAQADLEKEGFKDYQVIAVSFDSQFTESVECVQQYVLCKGGTSFKRFICKGFNTPFIQFVSGGSK